MPPLPDPFRFPAPQYLYHISRPEPLPGADYRRQRLLRDFRSVILLPGLQTVVAGPAVLVRPFLPQILQHELAPAPRPVAQRYHLLQTLPGAFPFLRILDLSDKVFLPRFVAIGIIKHALARQPVAPRPPGFLIVALDALGQIVMHHQPHIRLVDPHPESDGRRHDRRPVADEPILHPPPLRRLQPRMVRLRPQPPLRQRLRHLLRRLARAAIDDRRIPPPRPQQRQQPRKPPFLRHNAVGKVGAVETGYEHPRIIQPQLRQNIRPHPFRRRRRQSDHRRPRRHPPQTRQLPVSRTEFMPPFGNAMRLVNRDQPYLQRRQKIGEPRLDHPFRRHIQQLELPRPHPPRRLRCLLRRLGAVDEPRRQPVSLQRIHLVFHQRDQRRNHQRQPRPRHRRQLVAQRLAAPGGHQRKTIPPRHHRPDDFLLQRQKFVVSETGFQQFAHTAHCSRLIPMLPPPFPGFHAGGNPRHHPPGRQTNPDAPRELPAGNKGRGISQRRAPRKNAAHNPHPFGPRPLFLHSQGIVKLHQRIYPEPGPQRSPRRRPMPRPHQYIPRQKQIQHKPRSHRQPQKIVRPS